MVDAAMQQKADLAHQETLSRRERERKQWDAWWKVVDMESKGNPIKRYRYWAWRFFDAPITWWRENIIEPMHDKNKWPFYHQRFARVRDIDQCPLGDHVCMYEANWQFRLDKMVDTAILNHLRKRFDNCEEYYYKDWRRCTEALEEVEENELNYYIKYGDLGTWADSVDCYMKQKHRMVWERRHPKLMEMRAKALQEHKEDLKSGKFDLWFWKRAFTFQWKAYTSSVAKNLNQERALFSRECVSQDPLYYKEAEERKARGEYMHPSEEYKPWDALP